MSKTANEFSPEVRERAVRLVLDNEGQHGSRWQTVMSISVKIGCAPQSPKDWVKKAEVDSGKRVRSSAKRQRILRWPLSRFAGKPREGSGSSTAGRSDGQVHR